MSHIKVQFSLLKDINLIISTSSKNILEAKDDFKNAISKLDWEVKAQSNISVRAARAVGELRCYNTALNWYSNYLDTAYVKYAALENYDNGLKGVGDVTTYSPASSVSVIDICTSNYKEFELVGQHDNEIRENIFGFSGALMKFGSSILKLLEKYKSVKVFNGALGDLFGLGATVVETIENGFKSVEGFISTCSKMSSQAFSMLSKIFKDDTPAYGKISTVLSLFSETIKLETKPIEEILQSAGGLITGIGNLTKIYIGESWTKRLVDAGLTEKLAKSFSKDFVKVIAEETIAPLVAAASMATRLVGDGIEFAKDGFTWNDFGKLALNTGLAGASSLAKFYTCGLVNIDVDKTSEYIVNAGNKVNDFFAQTNLPTWAKVTGVILGSPVTLGIGLGDMINDKVAEIVDGCKEISNEYKINQMAKSIQL